MSGSVGVERIFPINLPALQKLKLTKEVKYVELVSSTLEILLVKKLKLKKEDTKTNLYFLKIRAATLLRLFLLNFYSRFKQNHSIISLKFPIFGRFYKLYSKQTHNIHV